MTECQAKTRQRVRAVAERIGGIPHVEAVDMIAPDDSKAGEWTLDIMCVRTCDGVPSDVLTILGGHGFAMRWSGNQGEHPQAIAVVERGL